MTSSILEVRHLTKEFKIGGLLSRKKMRAVDDVSFALPADRPTILSIVGESGIPVECIGGRAAKRGESQELSTEEYNDRIIATCASRPCTADDLAESLGFQKPNLEAHLRRMEKAGFITCEVGPRGIYYRAGKK